MMKTQLFMDRSLARRLERAEGAANAATVTTRARLNPAMGAAWIDVSGTYAMFDGPGSPMTQSFGLGIFAEATDATFEQLEAFFRMRGAETHHETSPLAGATLFGNLAARGYRPIEVSTVLVQPLTEPREAKAGPRVRIAGEQDRERWIETAVAGWAEKPEYIDFIRDLTTLTFANPDTLKFIAEDDHGEPMGTGGLVLHEGVALLAGASTAPKHRSRGAQGALLAARLEHARAAGCDLAMMVTEPGSASQRNAERSDFRVAYSRTKWALSI
ncbi:GNAT family N-acetyltransferase [Pendulispora brunnea]|uniref:GNAT family N-acetyltransferase n=1 Tax=Pendulispora brunnea TaxID=2905690 RepID=A0ABZ2JYB7_9BACT